MNTVFCQDTLTLEQAIQRALEQNFNIKIAQNAAEIATINNTKANAGMLPVVALNANENLTTALGFRQRFASGSEIRRAVGLFNAFNVNVTANWTVYDGGRNKLEKQRLEQLDEAGRLQIAAEANQLVAQVALAWLDISRKTESLKNTDEIITLLQERNKLANDRLNFGLGNKVDVLQAQIDINSRMKDRILAENARNDAKRQLNTLLERDPETPLSVPLVSAQIPQPIDTAALMQQILTTNADIAVLRNRQKVASIVAQRAAKLGSPTVSLTGAYSFQNNNNSTGFSLFSQQHGVLTGVNFSMPIYNGGNLKRQASIADIETKTVDLQIRQLEQSLRQQMMSLASLSNTLRQSMSLDEQTLTFSREQQKIALERFRLGQSNAIEVREAQIALENALFEAQQTKYDLHTTDILIQALLGN